MVAREDAGVNGPPVYGSRGPPGAWDESESWGDQLADQIADYDGYDGTSYASW